MEEEEKKRSQDSTLSSAGNLFFCILCLVLFKTAVSSLLLNWVLFLANSSPSQSRGSWELPRSLTITSVKHLGDNWLGFGQTCFFFPLSLFLSLSLHNGDKEHGHKKRSESLNPFPDKALYRWPESQIALPQSGPAECENGWGTVVVWAWPSQRRCSVGEHNT